MYARRRRWTRICKRKVALSSTLARGAVLVGRAGRFVCTRRVLTAARAHVRARRAGKKPVVTNEYIEKFYEMTAAAEGLEARHQPSEALDMYEKAIGNMLAGIKSKATSAAGRMPPCFAKTFSARLGGVAAVVADREQKLQLKGILEPCFERAEQLADELRQQQAGSSRASPATTPRPSTASAPTSPGMSSSGAFVRGVV